MHCPALADDFSKNLRGIQMEACPKNILFALIGCLLMTGIANGEAEPGQRAPDFVLPSLSDSNLRLSEYRSDVVVLNFWSKNCARCEKALALIESVYEEHRAEGLQVLGIAIDGDPDEAKRVVQKHAIAYPVMLDQDYLVSRLYDLGRLPVTVVIDREGDVVFIDEGFRRDSDENIRAAVAGVLKD